MPTPPLAKPAAAAAPASAHGTAYVIKTSLCAVGFLLAAAYFAYVCGEVLADYFLLFAPTKEATFPWLIRAGVAAFLFLLAFAVTVVLVRPVALIAATILGGMVVYALVLGGGQAIWLGAGAGAAMLLGLAFSVVRQLENQIDFSSRPMSDKELALASVLAVLIAVPAGFGYAKDAERGRYVIPPQITAYAQSRTEAYVAKAVDSELVPAMLRQTAMEAAKEQTSAMIKGLEKMAEPYGPYIPYVLGVLAYFTFQVVLFIPGFAASLLLWPLLMLLRLTGFAHVAKETRVVTRLTLARGEASSRQDRSAGDPWVRGT